MTRSLADLLRRRTHAHGARSNAVELAHMQGAPIEDVESVQRQGQQRTGIGNMALANLPVGNRVTVTQLAVVTGIARYPLNDQHDPFSDGDVIGRSEAMLAVFDRICAQLRAKATDIGADGVVEITFQQEEFEYERNDFTFQEIVMSAVGVAVKVSGIPVPHRPFLTNSTSQDVSLLASEGLMPADLALGYTTYYVAMTAKDKADISGLKRSMQNVEMTHLVDGVYRARELVMRRITERAAAVEASGVIAIRTFMDVEAKTTHKVLNYLPETATDYRVTCYALGTAIIQVDTGVKPPLAPSLVLNLGDGGRDDHVRGTWVPVQVASS